MPAQRDLSDASKADPADSIASDYRNSPELRGHFPPAPVSNGNSSGRLNIRQAQNSSSKDYPNLKKQTSGNGTASISEYATELKRAIPLKTRGSTLSQAGWRLRKPGLDLLTKAQQMEQRVLADLRRKANRSAAAGSPASRSGRQGNSLDQLPQPQQSTTRAEKVVY